MGTVTTTDGTEIFYKDWAQASRSSSATAGRFRAVNGTIALRVPLEVIKAKCAPYLKFGKPERVTPLVNLDDHTIISTYGVSIQG
jgi:hypothetical protein